MPHAPHARAAILSVGDELVLGQKLDTNAKWLASRLTDLGIVPVEFATVADDVETHTQALRRLSGLADVIISTGGLGPTADDLTREALVRAAADELIEDAEAMIAVEEFFRARGRVMPPGNRVQALRPSRGTCLPNPNGTAPGLWASIARPGKEACDVFCLPGPPAEMMPMFRDQVVPRLKPPPGREVRSRVMRCIGIGESDIAMRLGDLMRRDRMPLVGTTASCGVVDIRLRYEGLVGAGTRALDDAAALVRAAVGPHVFVEGDTSLAECVVGLLRARGVGGVGGVGGERVSVVESCTGGMLGAAITAVAGSSAVFVGGWITYTNEMKAREVGVPRELLSEISGAGAPGAVSREAVEAMAKGGLRRSGAGYCLAITGIAGPDGGSEEKPVGTVWIALAQRDGPAGSVMVDCRRFLMVGDRQAVRDWSVTSALSILWAHLVGRPELRMLRQVEG